MNQKEGLIVKDFLEKHIDGYMFKDLENIASIKLEGKEECGACGYPMVLTILSGMELLGAIISKEKITQKNIKASCRFFKKYWNDFFIKAYPSYDIVNVANLVYKLVRNGLAHCFLAKPGIYITKGVKDLHMKINKREKILVIDALELLKDFKYSYTKLVKPIALGNLHSDLASVEDVRKRIGEIATIYTDESNSFFSNIPKNRPIASFSMNSSIGSPAQSLSSFIHNASCSDFYNKNR